MNDIPSAKSHALHVARAKAAVRWATAEAIMGCEVNGFAKDTWLTAVHHLLVMPALNPNAVALKAEHLSTLYHIVTGPGRHTRVRFLPTSCRGANMPALDEAETAPKLCVQDSTAMTLKRKHGDVQLGTGTVTGSKQAATEHTRLEQFGEASRHNGSTFCARAADRTLTSKMSCPVTTTEHLERACKTRRRSLSPDIRRDVHGVS